MEPLRDPIWQFVGVVIAIIALIVSIPQGKYTGWIIKVKSTFSHVISLVVNKGPKFMEHLRDELKYLLKTITKIVTVIYLIFIPFSFWAIVDEIKGFVSTNDSFSLATATDQQFRQLMIASFVIVIAGVVALWTHFVRHFVDSIPDRSDSNPQRLEVNSFSVLGLLSIVLATVFMCVMLSQLFSLIE